MIKLTVYSIVENQKIKNTQPNTGNKSFCTNVPNH